MPYKVGLSASTYGNQTEKNSSLPGVAHMQNITTVYYTWKKPHNTSKKHTSGSMYFFYVFREYHVA